MLITCKPGLINIVYTCLSFHADRVSDHRTVLHLLGRPEEDVRHRSQRISWLKFIEVHSFQDVLMYSLTRFFGRDILL